MVNNYSLPLHHLHHMTVVTGDAYVDIALLEIGKPVLQAAYRANAPFSVRPSQTFRMNTSHVGKARLYPDVPKERFHYLQLTSRRYFVHDYPSQRVPVFGKDITAQCKVGAGKEV